MKGRSWLAGVIVGYVVGVVSMVGYMVSAQPDDPDVVSWVEHSEMTTCGPYYSGVQYQVEEGWIVIYLSRCNEDNEVEQYSARWLKVQP